MSIEEIRTIRARLIKPGFNKQKSRLEPTVTKNLSSIPFYKQLLVDYLGGSYTNQMYDELFDEVARDVDFRFKQLNLHNVIN